MINVQVNAKQTPDSNIESPAYQCLQGVYNTGPVTMTPQLNASISETKTHHPPEKNPG